jgi:amino acid permease
LEGEGKGTVFGSTCVLVQSIIGGGLLAYPAGYKMGGFGGMLLFQAMLMVFIAGGLRMIAFSAQYTNADTYQLIVRKLLGKRAESICCGSIVLLIFGACVVYTDIVVDQIQGVANKISGCIGDISHSAVECSRWYVQRGVLTFFVCGFIFILCLVRSISKLAGVSVVGFISMIYVAIVVVLEFQANGPASTQPWGSPAAIFKEDARDWLGILPVICFGFQGHIAAVPLYAEMRNRSLPKFDRVIMLALGACLAVYNLTGAVGYLTYGERTQGDILLNMDETKGTVVVARVAVAVAVTVTYAILHFCARSVVLDGIMGWRAGGSKASRINDTPGVQHYPHTPRLKAPKHVTMRADGAEYGTMDADGAPSCGGRGGKKNEKKAQRREEKARPILKKPVVNTSSSINDLTVDLLTENGGAYLGEDKSRQGAITVDVLPLFQVGGAVKPGVSGPAKVTVKAGKTNNSLFLGITLLWAGAVLVIALAVPNISSIVSIIGNLSSFFMFQFPGLMYMSMALRKPPEEWSVASVRELRRRDMRTFLVGIGYFLLGNAIFIVGISTAIYNLGVPAQ